MDQNLVLEIRALFGVQGIFRNRTVQKQQECIPMHAAPQGVPLTWECFRIAGKELRTSNHNKETLLRAVDPNYDDLNP